MRGFIPIPILLVLTVVFVSFFVVPKITSQNNQVTNPSVTISPTPDPFGNWKTYKNTKQSFTIRYPRDLYIKEHVTDAVDFISDPNVKEATPAAIKVRYSSASDAADLKEFEKIAKLEPNQEIREPLDVKSIITKIRNLKVGDYDAVEYVVNRNFTALEGPKTEYRHVYEVKKDNTILEFISTDEIKEAHQRLDPIFGQMVSSINF